MSERMETEGKEVLRALSEAGYEAYFVGGCVRDKALGRPLKDIDIATSALPDEVMRLFPRHAPTGLAHGTVTVIREQHTFEVTTFRKESEYEQFRRPKEVEFISDLNEDLRRRDFTINAMALDAHGTRYDPFGGSADLEAGVVRCVGNPLERFHEDALRMLRAIRFACEYGFSLQEATWEALLRHAPLLAHVAMERVGAELDKMIEGRSPDRAVKLLAESGLTRHFKQPVVWPLAEWDLVPELCAAVKLTGVTGPELRWTALFVLLEMSSGQAREAMKRLKFSGKKSAAIVRLLQMDEWMRQHLDKIRMEDEQAGFETWAGACVMFGKPVALLWLELASWQTESLDGRNWRQLLELGPGWIERIPADRVTELAVNGTELAVELDKPAGPWLGALLQELLVETAKLRIRNERDILIQEAKNRVKRETM
ncbi:CCA tRNA nucleotidyltransferase [Paenibacillus oceani]|uniref:CCA tRNA nucleotidyltransferase n=1 Tax=Paenibacillus oceani TaxID=2772510 RepID=A0A927C4M6_9BACL|nr:CCA tRNA nucleotidyltransferase [Paenibacillus oceani]MBD2861253.1 CCA tRNA nucleotidyltransferase [Paenibacillus oceani]